MVDSPRAGEVDVTLWIPSLMGTLQEVRTGIQTSRAEHFQVREHTFVTSDNDLLQDLIQENRRIAAYSEDTILETLQRLPHCSRMCFDSVYDEAARQRCNGTAQLDRERSSPRTGGMQRIAVATVH